MNNNLCNTRVVRIDPLPSPNVLKEKLPSDGARRKLVSDTRESLREIIHGRDERFCLIVGPCSIHDYEVAIDYGGRLAKKIKAVQDRMLVIMRVYFEKPRTSTGWRGLIYDPHLNESYEIEKGLETARSLLLELAGMGVTAGTEALDPVVPQYLDDLICWASIGARTTESQTHRELASGLSMPVGFKNGTDGYIDTVVNSLVASRKARRFIGIDGDGRSAVVETRGNLDTHLVLRGGRARENYHPDDLAEAVALLRKHHLPEAAIIDCNHGNSRKDHRKQREIFSSALRQRLDGQRAIIGCMVESNIYAGRQSMEGYSGRLRYGVSITDPCIGWDETEEMIDDAYRQLG